MAAQPLHLTDFFDWGRRTYVMGIINVTPDSFSHDGLMSTVDWVEAAAAKAREFVAQGAQIVDVGGESTRPGADPVSTDEELARVVPAIAAIAAECDVHISVDTWKARVAAAALDAGACMVNDVWSLTRDPDLAPLLAERGTPVILMHNRSRDDQARHREQLGGRYVGSRYDDLIADVASELTESADSAKRAGIHADQIILDPGIGFGKTVEQNLQLVDRLDRIKGLGYPVLFGPSRKSFIGYSLNLPADDRLEGTAAAVAVGIARGADIIRVHDVKAMARVARMTDAIIRQS